MKDISKDLLLYGAVLLLILRRSLNDPSETLVYTLRFSAFLLLSIRCFLHKTVTLSKLFNLHKAYSLTPSHSLTQ